MNTDTTRPGANLLAVISAVGPQLLSFLPLGTLLNGYASPLLICKSFRESTHLAIGAFEILDFSQCSHLRKIDDRHLIALINDILIAIESHRMYHGAEILLQLDAVRQLDLSRCRKIHGKAIKHCMRFMPNVQRISVASCSKFDPCETFHNEDDYEEFCKPSYFCYNNDVDYVISEDDPEKMNNWIRDFDLVCESHF